MVAFLHDLFAAVCALGTALAIVSAGELLVKKSLPDKLAARRRALLGCAVALAADFFRRCMEDLQ